MQLSKLCQSFRQSAPEEEEFEAMHYHTASFRFWTIVLSAFVLTACQKSMGRRGGGDATLAAITVKELSRSDYDRMRLQAFAPDDSSQARLDLEATRGRGTLEASLAPGNYVFKLEYFAGASVRYSSVACGNPAEFALAAGNNTLTIYLCDTNGRRVTTEEISCNPGDPAHGPRQLRLLTNAEYQRTVQDLVGISTDIVAAFHKNVKYHGIDNLADTRKVTDAHAEAYYRAATTIAAKIRSDRRRFSACTPGEPDSICITRFIRSFGKRAFRGPVTEAEQAGLLRVFDAERQAGGSFDDALELTAQAILISPRFLYRYELGHESNEAFELDAWEIAQALSYLYWGSMPDERLFNLAESGALRQLATIKTESARLLDDPRAREIT